jgi:hypothetical protein
MTKKRTKMCAHIPCVCEVAYGQEFCGDSCRLAGSEDVEIACQCDHAACPLTSELNVGIGAASVAKA